MSASILSRGSQGQPLVVDTGTWGPESIAGVVLSAFGVVLSAFTVVVTAFIPIMIWRYDKQARTRSEKHEQELRLQEHTKLLSNTDAMHRIGEFQQQCADMYEDLPVGEQRPSYGAVFRHGRQLSGNGTCVTKETLSSVDAARKELQGIWDNIYGDFRGQRLPGTITDGSNGRILKRGQTYMAAAEPLEAANHGRMEDRGHVDPSPPYLIPTLQNGQLYPYFGWNVRPKRFRWPEDQQAMFLTNGLAHSGRNSHK